MFEIALFEECGMGDLIDIERKGCESIIHDHDCDLWVTTMVGWADVPFSDWGDFRRRRAIDISSLSIYFYFFYFIFFGGGWVLSSNAFTIWCCILIIRPPRVIRRFKRRSCDEYIIDITIMFLRI